MILPIVVVFFPLLIVSLFVWHHGGPRGVGLLWGFLVGVVATLVGWPLAVFAAGWGNNLAGAVLGLLIAGIGITVAVFCLRASLQSWRSTRR